MSPSSFHPSTTAPSLLRLTWARYLRGILVLCLRRCLRISSTTSIWLASFRSATELAMPLPLALPLSLSLVLSLSLSLSLSQFLSLFLCLSLARSPSYDYTYLYLLTCVGGNLSCNLSIVPPILCILTPFCIFHIRFNDFIIHIVRYYTTGHLIASFTHGSIISSSTLSDITQLDTVLHHSYTSNDFIIALSAITQLDTLLHHSHVQWFHHSSGKKF